MTVENDNGTPRINGLAAMTVFEHEREMCQQRRSYRRVLKAIAAVVVTNNLAWYILTRKH